MARVQLRNLCKVFPGGVEAVKNVNIEMADGEFVVLVGPSGCGKSTTLRMIAGLEEPSSGEVYIGDRLVNDVAPKDRDIAMVFQNYALYPHMTVYRNMAFGLEMRGYKRAEIDRRVREAAEILGIGDLLERRPKALSGGQRQRVAVGRAIVRHPQVFLFDEPLSNLDAKLRVQMRTEISRLHQRLKTTMVYVTHDQVEAMTMGDRIVVMHKGEVQDINTPLGLYNDPKNRFVAGFIGSPPMNFVKGRIGAERGALNFISEDGHVHLAVPVEKQSALQSYMDRPVLFGVRPEDLHECAADADTAARIEAIIDVVEPMGSETNVYFSLGGAQATARLRAECLPAENAPFSFTVDMAKCHFFDPQSERKIA